MSGVRVSSGAPLKNIYALMAGVAQLVRAPDCGSGGRGFDSRRSPHFFVYIIFKLTVNVSNNIIIKDIKVID